MKQKTKAFRKGLAASALAAAVGIVGVAGGIAAGHGIVASAEVQPLFTSAYSSKAEAMQAGLDLNLKIAAEGMVLLKNEDNALPIASGGVKGSRVTLFGYNGTKPSTGGSMNGGDTSGGIAGVSVSIYDSLEQAGFRVNPVVRSQYESWAAQMTTGEKPTAMYTDDTAIKPELAKVGVADTAWTKSLDVYNDAALIVLGKGSSAIGEGEGKRLHSLQLDAAQYDLVDYVVNSGKFNRVVLLLNTCTPLELDLDRFEDVNAILQIGEPGDNGLGALGKVLNGTISPSGRLSDTWAKDFTQDPSYYNFNTRTDTNAWCVDGAGKFSGYTRYKVGDTLTNTWAVGYEEGIYNGYRYYETRAYDEGGSWWEDNVNWTFGYGLSYTQFEWDVVGAQISGNGQITQYTTVTFDVRVTNVGWYSGKDVVELYYTAPYTKGGIEKAHVVLADYAKTDTLKPGESQVVHLTIDVKDMASYDYKEDKTYVLEAGNYDLKLMQDAHTIKRGWGLAYDEETGDMVEGELKTSAPLGAKIKCDKAVTGATITNHFDDVTKGFEDNGYKQLSRADWIDDTADLAYFFGERTANLVADQQGYTKAKVKTITEEEYAKFDYNDALFNGYYDASKIPEIKLGDASARTAAKYKIVLADLIGADADDPRYQELVEQLTVEEMIDMVNHGGFNSRAFDYIGKPYSHDTDGPKGWTGSGTDSNDRFNFFASEPMIASTYNKQLAREMGEMIGEQGLWGNSTQEGGIAYNYTGWYAPGMNIHRGYFDSRYTEYYSEDPVLTGMTAASASLGAKSKGCYVTLKHFAFHNDGGGAFSYRMGSLNTKNGKDGLAAWMNEQTIRELYLKGYQIAVEDGEATFAMGSFTRIGHTWCGGSYAVNTQLLRDEWGFKGAVVTDIVLYNGCNAYQLIKCGANLMLHAGFMQCGVVLDKATIDAMNANDKKITLYCLQQATKQVLYMVANSNAMQLPKGAKVNYEAITEVDGEEVALTLADATVGTAYSSVALNNATLNTNYAFSEIKYTVKGLPAGLSYDAATGKITGTPTKAGTYAITVIAEAEGYKSASIDLTLSVNAKVEEQKPPVEEKPNTDNKKKSGCGGVIGTTSAVVAGLAILGGAVLATRKKKED